MGQLLTAAGPAGPLNRPFNRPFNRPLNRPLDQVLEMAEHNMGYNAATGEFIDMIKGGIIDPLKVRCRCPGGGGCTSTPHTAHATACNAQISARPLEWH